MKNVLRSLKLWHKFAALGAIGTVLCAVPLHQGDSVHKRPASWQWPSPKTRAWTPLRAAIDQCPCSTCTCRPTGRPGGLVLGWQRRGRTPSASGERTSRGGGTHGPTWWRDRWPHPTYSKAARRRPSSLQWPPGTRLSQQVRTRKDTGRCNSLAAHTALVERQKLHGHRLHSPTPRACRWTRWPSPTTS